MRKTKTCNKCNAEKPLTNEHYSKRKDSKDGFNTICKECINKYNKKYWEENKKKLSEQQAEYYQQNKEKFAEYNIEYKKKHKEELLEYNRSYYKEKREEILEQKKEYYQDNKESKLKYRGEHYKLNRAKLIKYARSYYKANKNKIAEYNKEYREKNRDLRNTLEHKRRARKRKLPNDFTKEDWERTKKYFNYQCSYCGDEVELTQEHFTPLSKGGGYTVNNIIPACVSCNCSKKDRDFLKWYPEQKFYSEVRENKILEYLNYIEDDIQQLALY